MYTRVFIILMIILWIFGLLSSSILYYGFDPSYHPVLSVVMMSLSLFLGLWSLMGLGILGIKKIIRRGYIYPILLILWLFLLFVY